VEGVVLAPIDQQRRSQGDAPALKDLLLPDKARAELPTLDPFASV